MSERASSKKRGACVIIAGAFMLSLAVLLFCGNLAEDMRAGKRSEKVVTVIEAAIEEAAVRDETAEADSPSAPAGEYDAETQTVTVGGYAYIGYICIPKLSLELPVMADWDYDRLKTAPCRQYGAAMTDDLVIAGHNYKSHFARLKELACGDTVVFRGADGRETVYSVEDTGVLGAEDITPVRESGYDLVLYTCTYTGKERVTVFCRRTQTNPM